MVEQTSHEQQLPEETRKVFDYVREKFYAEYLEGLKEFVRIPSLSPLFDEEWQTNRNLFKQMDHLVNFTRAQNVEGIEIKPLEEPGRSPFLIVDIAAKAGSTTTSEKTVLMYGHMDKQPFGEGWNTDPCEPVIKDGLMFGRGSNDDGYSLFCAILSVKACQTLGLGHPRVVITIEGSEEGEIDDLLFYMRKYKDQLGNPDLVICLDSISYDTSAFFVTSTLRGCINFDLKVQTSTANFHSGFSGIMPQPYPILNKVLQRALNFETQTMHEQFQPEIPQVYIDSTHSVARIYSDCNDAKKLPETERLTRSHAEGADCEEKLQCLLNQWWRPTLNVIGIEGLPSDLAKAGNVCYSQIKYRLSMRTSPNQDCEDLAQKLEAAFSSVAKEDIFGAKVEFKIVDKGNGFCAPDLPADIKSVLFKSAQEVFESKDPLFVGCGGSIPFMEIFATEFPNANFLLTGCATESGNAHCANENIDLEYCRKFITAISLMLSRMP